jgi:hypothetical protein
MLIRKKDTFYTTLAQVHRQEKYTHAETNGVAKLRLASSPKIW